MQTTYTGYIPRAEWRWVALVSLTLILIAFAPFVVISLRNNPETNWRFLGLLHRFQTSTAYLARMEQGAEGLWLVHFWHTPDAHSSALIEPVYPLLGQVARLTSLSVETIFHVTRLFAAVFMYFAIYQLGANIWVRVRARRIFFVVATIGTGLGWLLAITTGLLSATDLNTPQAFPFSGTLFNVHYPLSIGCLALLAGILITVFRPGETAAPDVRNMGLITVLMSVALVFLYPETLAPLGVALAGSIIAVWVSVLRPLLTSKIAWYRAFLQATQHIDRETRWGLWVLIPALPVLAYYLVTLRINPAVAEWVQQKTLAAPTPFALLIGLGLPLIAALPAMYRALREFNADTDRFMLLWLVGMIGGMYLLPFGGGRDLLTGIMLPIAYFTTRSIEDVWIRRIARRTFRRAIVILVPLVAVSSLFTLMLPIMQPLFQNQDAAGMLLEPDYVAAFRWLQIQTTSEDVILAAPDNVSAWIPAWVEARVIYGHPYETLHASARRQAVLDWYRITNPTEPLCRALLRNNAYQVAFVLNGPRERQIGSSACFENLRFAASFGQVDIYRLP